MRSRAVTVFPNIMRSSAAEAFFFLFRKRKSHKYIKCRLVLQLDCTMGLCVLVGPNATDLSESSVRLAGEGNDIVYNRM